MLPGKTATKNAAAVPPTSARAGCFQVAISAPPRASSTMPEATTTVSGSAGNHDGTCAWNSWRCFVRWPVPAMSSPAPSAAWATALRARRVVEWAVMGAPSWGWPLQPFEGAAQLPVGDGSAVRRELLARVVDEVLLSLFAERVAGDLAGLEQVGGIGEGGRDARDPRVGVGVAD